MKKVSLLILLLAFACTSTTPGISILENSPCQMPCWNEITPGVTTQAEAIEIAKSLSYDNVIVFKQPWKVFDEYLKFSLELNDTLVQGEIYFTAEKVNVMILSGETGLTFGQMVNKIGVTAHAKLG